MSRIGKKPITIPKEVNIKMEGKELFVSGPKGKLQIEIRPEIKVEQKDGQVLVSPLLKTKDTSAYWGLERTLIYNMVEGVTNGFEKKLELRGVGYGAEIKEEDLILKVGFSHLVTIKRVEGLKFSVEKNFITVSGINKELVGQIAAKIRKVRPPEPYKGKGIRYVGEIVRRKTGKKAAGTGK